MANKKVRIENVIIQDPLLCPTFDEMDSLKNCKTKSVKMDMRKTTENL